MTMINLDAFPDQISKMLYLRHELNWTLDKIGIYFGMSRQAVQQKVGNTGYIGIRNDVRRGKRHIVESTIQDGEHDELTTTQIAQIYDYSKQTISKMWNGKVHNTDRYQNELGRKVEKYISQLLTDNNIPHTLKERVKDFDITLENGKTIEVQARTKEEKFRTSKDFYFFCIKNSMRKGIPDFFILVIWNVDVSVFILPKSVVPEHGGVGFVYPPTEQSYSGWAEYENRFDLLRS